MKNLAPLLLAAVLFTACAKKDADPLPADPSPETTMARTLVFPTAGSLNNDTTYLASVMTSDGQLDNAQLVVAFSPQVGRDAIRFTVPKAALTPSLLGSYKIVGVQRSPGTVASVYYNFHVARNLKDSGSFLIFGETNNTSGQLVITSYDASRRLLGGTYEMVINDMQNITDKFSVPNAPPLCNLRTTGTFTNLKLK